MTPLAFILFFVNAVLLLTLPRKWAALPLLVGCCYMTLGTGLSVGSISLPVFRLLLATGLLRVIMRGERPSGGWNTIDTFVLVLGIWMMLTSLMGRTDSGMPIPMLGFVLNFSLVYFLIRCFAGQPDALRDLLGLLAILLIPLAAEMVLEKLTGRNLFSVFGRVSEFVVIRNGRLRAQGPFAHSILAGTVGAVCLPLMVALYNRQPKVALAGIVSCLTIVYASGSSGPIMSTLSGLFALSVWRFRELTKTFRVMAVLGYILLEFVMTPPAYFILARIDLTGGSTGWHRAQLIRTAFNEHFGEWWLRGTDFTRTWMPTGVAFSENHTDITNYYLLFGVASGLFALLLVVFILTRAFRWVGELVRSRSSLSMDDRFTVWCLGAGMFVHMVTSISVSYFDQSQIFFWLNLAAISSVYSTTRMGAPSVRKNPETSRTSDGRSSNPLQRVPTYGRSPTGFQPDFSA